jgi:hypothetical protein
MACKEYTYDIEINKQTITYCGVNAHAQNGIAERSIRTLCDRARTIFIHALEKWPEAIGLDLWPYALKMAADIHNATPGPSGLSPEEIFSRQKARPDCLLDFHTFGCPVFVLDPTLQKGQKIPKCKMVVLPSTVRIGTIQTKLMFYVFFATCMVLNKPERIGTKASLMNYYS